MDRRTFLGIAGLALASTARAQSSERVYRVGMLNPGTLPPASDTVLADWIWAPLREFGYVEGRNLVIERKYAEGNFERIPVMAKELVQGRVDVILAIGTQAAQAAKAATTTVPIVFLNNADPRAVGLAASLAKPGGNLTGVLIAPEGSLAPKKLELLKEAVPRATRIAFIFPEDYGAGAELQVRDIKEAGVALRVDVPVVRVKSRNYAAAFAAVTATKAEALFVGAHSLFLSDRRIVIDLATKHRLPAIYEWPSFVKDGGLMSYGASDIETYRKVATYLDIVLKGANAGDVPIWQPTNLYLVVNTRAAKEIGLTLPPAILLRADELVK